MSRPLQTKMAWEWNWPTFWKWTKAYQIQLLSFDWNFAVNGDHSPGVWVSLVILNLKLLDFGYYNIYHEEDDEDFTEENPNVSE